jgi:hypothetical protein
MTDGETIPAWAVWIFLAVVALGIEADHLILKARARKK